MSPCAPWNAQAEYLIRSKYWYCTQLTSDSSLTTEKSITPKFIKMKSMMIVTAACLLVLTFTTTAFADLCTDLNTPGSDLSGCVADYASNPESICSGACKDLLFEYADDCLEAQAGGAAAADTYKDGINTVCGDARMGATLFSTISALLMAVFVALY